MQTRLGENIKPLHKEKGWSQAELAGRVKAHLTHINRLTGLKPPNILLL